MAAVGCLGDIVFQVSDEALETISNVEWSGSARYAVHQRHNMNALTEFTGVDPDKITFDMFLSYTLKVNVMDELVKIWTYERAGTTLPLEYRQPQNQIRAPRPLGQCLCGYRFRGAAGIFEKLR